LLFAQFLCFCYNFNLLAVFITVVVVDVIVIVAAVYVVVAVYPNAFLHYLYNYSSAFYVAPDFIAFAVVEVISL
jgi:hypothetical protein